MSDKRSRHTFEEVLNEVRDVNELVERDEQNDEEFSRLFDYKQTNRSIAIRYLDIENSQNNCSFHIDFHEDGEVTNSEVFETKAEVVDFIRNDLLRQLSNQ